MTNILLLTYMFPPAGGIGTPRALAYARYLPKQGCQLSIVAPTRPALRDTDSELSSMIPEYVKVYRAWNPELPMSLRDRLWKRNAAPDALGAHTGSLLRRLVDRAIFPDPQLVWGASALRKACRVIERDQIEMVIINMPPFSLLRAGIFLKRRFPDLQLVTDFRDEWLGYYLPQIDRASEEKLRRAQALERDAVSESTYVVTVTETWVNRLRKRYPREPATKFICTPNGYDPAFCRPLRGEARRQGGRVIITYFGTVHDNKVYSPENYLIALESLPDDIGRQIETRFIGRIVGTAKRWFENVRAPIKLLGFMPKSEGLRYLEETDVALLIATDPGSHAGKLFDYLALRKPVLAISPPGGEIDKLLQRTRSGWCADPWDVNAIRRMLIAAFFEVRQASTMIHPDENVIEEYSWPRIMAKFAAATGIGRVDDPAETARHSQTLRVGAYYEAFERSRCRN